MKYNQRYSLTEKWTKRLNIILIFTFLILGSLLYVEINRTSRSKTNENKQNDITAIHSDSPRCSANVSNIKLFLISINQSHTVRGNNFTLKGNVEWWNGTGYQNQSNIPVFPIIDGVKYNGEGSKPNLTVFTQSGATMGIFEISINVPFDYDYTVNMSITANVTEGSGIYVNELTVQSAPFSHDITTNTKISVTIEYLETRPPPLIPGDFFNIRVNLTDDTNQPLSANNLILGFNNYTDVNQTFNIISGIAVITNIYLRSNITSVHVNFSGRSFAPHSYLEYRPSVNFVSIKTFTGINLSVEYTNLSNQSSSEIYYNGQVRITITVTDSSVEGLPIKNRAYELNISGLVIVTGLTSTDGKIVREIDLSQYNLNSNSTLVITVRITNFDQVYAASNFVKDSTLELKNRPPALPDGTNELPPPSESNWWALIPIIVVFAILIIGVVIFQRKRMELTKIKDLEGRVLDTSVMGAVSSLFLTGRISEAIAYLFIIYRNTINGKFDLKPRENETLRDFGILVVNKYGQDPLRVHPFCSFVESFIYGGRKATHKDFERAVEMFQRLYWNLTGESLDYKIPTKSDNPFSRSISTSNE